MPVESDLIKVVSIAEYGLWLRYLVIMYETAHTVEFVNIVNCCE